MSERTFLAWCDVCGETRTVHGRPANGTYGAFSEYRQAYVCRCHHHRNPDKYFKVTTPEARALLRDPEWLRAAYAEHTVREIAARIGTSGGLVSHWMKNHGIPGRTREEALARFHATRRSSKNVRNRQMVTGGISDVPGVQKIRGDVTMPRGMHTGA